MYTETIIPKSAKHRIDIPKEFINRRITVMMEPKDSNGTKKKLRRSLRHHGKIKFRISASVRQWMGVMKSDKPYGELREDALFERYGIQ
jgi:hypothetical protein